MKPVVIINGPSVTLTAEEFRRYIEEAYEQGLHDGASLPWTYTYNSGASARDEIVVICRNEN